MPQKFLPGDFLVFQLESGYAMLRVLAVDGEDTDPVWHVSAYEDLFFDVDSAENASAQGAALKIRDPHLALTNRAFESTQVARISSLPLTSSEMESLHKWRDDPDHEVADRSVRLLLGLR